MTLYPLRPVIRFLPRYTLEDADRDAYALLLCSGALLFAWWFVRVVT